MEKILQLENRPTAVFACSDTIALGAYQLINGIRRDLLQANAVAGQIAAGDLAVAV